MRFRGADLFFKRPAKEPPHPSHVQKCEVVDKLNDTQTGMLLGIPRSARCVQRFDDSLNSAIHITYRISLRSSSMREPRDPLLKVVYISFLYATHSKHIREVVINDIDLEKIRGKAGLPRKSSSSPDSNASS